MERLESHEITPHLEAALMMAPPDTLEALGGSDRYRRNRAVSCLAEHLVSRLNCFDIVLTDRVRFEEIEEAAKDLELADERAFALGEPIDPKVEAAQAPRPAKIGPPKLSICE